jgi:molybdopterin-guanine dinucleotide biosynthesis protein A
MMLLRSQVALGILAGGRAQRLGGADKALAMHAGSRLVDRTLAALGDGYCSALISYNREGATLPARLRVVPDRRADFAGPLAGIEALLAACESPWLLSAPVDLDEIPQDVLERLAEVAGAGQGVVARDADGAQPLVALWPVRLALPAVSAALDAGEGAVHKVQAALGFASCDFSPRRFGNLNTPKELRA